MHPQLLIVRDFMGVPHVAIYSSATVEKVYITNERGFSKRMTGQYFPAIGFPRDDVFNYDDEAATAILAGKQCDWSKLQKWNG